MSRDSKVIDFLKLVRLLVEYVLEKNLQDWVWIPKIIRGVMYCLPQTKVVQNKKGQLCSYMWFTGIRRCLLPCFLKNEIGINTHLELLIKISEDAIFTTIKLFLFNNQCIKFIMFKSIQYWSKREAMQAFIFTWIEQWF